MDGQHQGYGVSHLAGLVPMHQHLPPLQSSLTLAPLPLPLPQIALSQQHPTISSPHSHNSFVAYRPPRAPSPPQQFHTPLHSHSHPHHSLPLPSTYSSSSSSRDDLDVEWSKLRDAQRQLDWERLAFQKEREDWERERDKLRSSLIAANQAATSSENGAKKRKRVSATSTTSTTSSTSTPSTTSTTTDDAAKRARGNQDVEVKIEGHSEEHNEGSLAIADEELDSSMDDANSKDKGPVVVGQTWDSRIAQLRQFSEENGHCRVPWAYKPCPQLGRWVSRMRALRKQGRLDPATVEKLEAVNFVWDPNSSHEKQWSDKIEALKAYKERFGHVQVAWGWKENPAFGRWVGRVRQQRRDGKLERSRIRELDSLGFVWGFSRKDYGPKGDEKIEPRKKKGATRKGAPLRKKHTSSRRNEDEEDEDEDEEGDEEEGEGEDDDGDGLGPVEESEEGEEEEDEPQIEFHIRERVPQTNPVAALISQPMATMDEDAAVAAIAAIAATIPIPEIDISKLQTNKSDHQEKDKEKEDESAAMDTTTAATTPSAPQATTMTTTEEIESKPTPMTTETTTTSIETTTTTSPSPSLQESIDTSLAATEAASPPSVATATPDAATTIQD